MEYITSPFGSDQLFLTHNDIDKLCLGETLRVGALEISIKKPDVILKRNITLAVPPCPAHPNGIFNVQDAGSMNVKFILDGATLKVKDVEVIK